MLFAPTYHKLREQALQLDTATFGLTPAPGGIYGVLGEFGFAEGVATVVALADGSVSMYFSGGGGSIGLGQHEGPREAARALLAEAPSALSAAAKDAAFPLPQAGEVRFWFLTMGGPVTVSATEGELPASKLARLHELLQELLTQIRLVNQKKRTPVGEA
jgi:hypothetical protein